MELSSKADAGLDSNSLTKTVPESVKTGVAPSSGGGGEGCEASHVVAASEVWAVGSKVAAAFTVGFVVGVMDGDAVGFIDGFAVGAFDCVAVGVVVGVNVGCIEGFLVGSIEGFLLGSIVGSRVGFIVGGIVGVKVGSFVGSFVLGPCVGARVTLLTFAPEVTAVHSMASLITASGRHPWPGFLNPISSNMPSIVYRRVHATSLLLPP